MVRPSKKKSRHATIAYEDDNTEMLGPEPPVVTVHVHEARGSQGRMRTSRRSMEVSDDLDPPTDAHLAHKHDSEDEGSRLLPGASNSSDAGPIYGPNFNWTQPIAVDLEDHFDPFATLQQYVRDHPYDPDAPRPVKELPRRKAGDDPKEAKVCNCVQNFTWR